MTACLAGDRDACGTLVERYQKPIYNLAYRITGSQDDALDATQTTFVRALEHLASFDGQHRFFSWLYRIGVRESLRIVGRTRERPAQEICAAAVSATAGPYEEAWRAEAGRILSAALDELGPDERTAIVLRHFHALSYEAIAEIAEVPVSTVKSRLFEARQKLRKILDRRGWRSACAPS